MKNLLAKLMNTNTVVTPTRDRKTHGPAACEIEHRAKFENLTTSKS